MTNLVTTAVTNQNREEAANYDWRPAITLLLNWLKNPRQLDDDGSDAPSETIIRLSLDVAERYAENLLPAPQRIVPDPNGGIVFERTEGCVSEVIHIWDDGEVEWMLFHEADLIDRSSLRLWPTRVVEESSRDFLASSP